MKPEVDQILMLSANQLLGTLVPLLPNSFAQGTASALGLAVMLAAQEYDRAAEIRLAENDEMRALFLAAAPVVKDEHLKAELSNAAQLRETSLKISALNEVNYALRRQLIRLHVHVEDTGLREFERRIWKLLQDSANRRSLKLT